MIEGHSPRQKSASVWKMDNCSPVGRLAGPSPYMLRATKTSWKTYSHVVR